MSRSYAADRIAERRKAVAMLERLISNHSKRFAYDAADALRAAKIDTEWALREHAAQEIAEGVGMHFVHERWPAEARAA